AHVPGFAPAIIANGALLPRRAHVVGIRDARTRAKRIDVETSAPSEPRQYRKLLAAAARGDVDENALDAMLVKARVAPIRYEIAQQPFTIDARAAIRQLQRRDVRLRGYRAHRPEQPARQPLVDDIAIRGKERRLDVVRVAGHAQIIDAVARQLANGLRLECRRPAQRDAHLRATGLRQVALDHRRDFGHAGATRLRERAEIELHRFRFDDRR